MYFLPCVFACLQREVPRFFVNLRRQHTIPRLPCTSRDRTTVNEKISNETMPRTLQKGVKSRIQKVAQAIASKLGRTQASLILRWWFYPRDKKNLAPTPAMPQTQQNAPRNGKRPGLHITHVCIHIENYL